SERTVSGASIRKFWLEQILRPFLSYHRRIAVVITALALLSLSTSLIILSLGPLIKVLFSVETGQVMPISDLLPKQLMMVWAQSWPTSFDVRTLGRCIPVVILIAGILKAISTYLYSLNQQAISLGVAMRLRVELFTRLLSLPYL